MKTNIVLIGLPGCGKTTIGKQLSQKLAFPFIDIDEEIEISQQKKISQLFENGETYFRDIETEVTKKVARADFSVISTGGGVVLREENMTALGENGLIIFLNRSVSDITGDIYIEVRPLLQDGVEKLKTLHKQRIHLYERYADLTINNNQALDVIIEQLIAELPVELTKGRF